MIKFFRKIRQNLLIENKMGKYFKYAIGEIILVVIGILIALQINNRNEGIKEASYEKNMLSEISNALERDLYHYKKMKSRLTKLDSATSVFLRHIHSKTKIFKDSLYRKESKRWYYLRTGILYQYNSGPYDALKSSGLDKISNENLRNELIYFYDFQFPFNAKQILYSENKYEEQILRLKSFLGKPFTENENGKIKVFKKFPENLFQNVEFLDLINDINFRAQTTLFHINVHLPLIEEMNKKVKNELTKND